MTESLCIFEGVHYERLLPLVYMRPTWDLRCGILTIREKIQRCYPGVPLQLHCRGYLTDLIREQNPGVPVNTINAKLASPAYAPVVESMRDAAIPSALNLFSAYAGSDKDLAPWLKDAAINHDTDMRLQYLAGLALNNNMERAIYSQMLTYRRYPENLFVVSDRLKPSLMMALQ